MGIFNRLRSWYKPWADRHHKMSLLFWPAAALLFLIRKRIRYTIGHLAEQRYDKTLDINTGGEIVGKRLMIAPEKSAYAKGYAGTPPAVAEYLIGLLAEEARGFTFVDYGAGKGRVLLIAARYQFRRVIGVELSEPLIRIAAANVAAYANKHAELCPIELVQTDAADYELPDDPCVLFFYDPFQASLMERIGQRIRQSFVVNPRKLFIIYYSQRSHMSSRLPSCDGTTSKTCPRDT